MYVACRHHTVQVSCERGKPADLLCDWKVKTKRSGTCDAPICARCPHVPAKDKDLCPDHAAEWRSIGIM